LIYPFIETEHQYDLGQNTYFYTFRNRFYAFHRLLSRLFRKKSK